MKNVRCQAKVYEAMKEDILQDDWALKIKNLLYKYGLGYNWEQQDELDKSNLHLFCLNIKVDCKTNFTKGM